MILIGTGLNYKTAPIGMREALTFRQNSLPKAVAALLGYVKNGVILSTCHRTEIYSIVGHQDSGARNLTRFLADYFSYPVDKFTPHLYAYSQKDAVRHLFRVASGLDSMVLGEDQVLAQIKSAYTGSLQANACGPVLSQLFNRSIRVGKAVRTETRISEYEASVSWAAVSYARQHLNGSFSGDALIIGAGKAAELAARAIVRLLDCRPTILSRTQTHAVKLAEKLGGIALASENLLDALARADLAISATESPSYILDRHLLEKAMIARNGRPLLLMDIAMPRDIDPSIRALEGVTLGDIDDLRPLMEERRRQRLREVEKAEEIVAREAGKFMQWWSSREAVPTIRALKHKAETIKTQEVEKTLRSLDSLTPQQQQKVEAMASAIVNKMLHQPVIKLKSPEEGHSYIKPVRDLFELGETPSLEEQASGRR